MKSVCTTMIAAAILLISYPHQLWPQPQSSDEKSIGILLAAGDIAKCTKEKDGEIKPGKAAETADLLGREIAKAEQNGVPVRVRALGDLAYDHGTAEEFEQCFDKTWGQHIHVMLPVPGNHEYEKPNPDAAPYFNYFKDNDLVSANGPRAGYYSLYFPDKDRGPWHLIALNAYAGIGRRSAQMQWLKEKALKPSSMPCVLAFWHPFVFSSGHHGHNDSKNPKARVTRGTTMLEAYRTLHGHGASVVLAGHDHNFEQFGRQDVNGKKVADGIRSFVVGTGGGRLYNRVTYATKAENREAYDQDTHGVLKIELFPDRYKWDFIPIDGAEKDVTLEIDSDDCNQRRTP